MNCVRAFALFLICLYITACDSSVKAQSTEEFTFQYNGLRYGGIIEYPQVEASSLVVIIPGHGKTDFVGDDQWLNVRQFFNSLGMTVIAWDRAGCGKSEGAYNHEQSVQSSAEEAGAALAEIRRLKVDGYETMGFWGMSRGGWIVPLTIANEADIAFWISASGTDQYETFPYLLETNFRLQGASEAEVKLLMHEWEFRNKAFLGTTTYEEFLQGTKTLAVNALIKRLGITTPTEAEFYAGKEYYQSLEINIDPVNGRQIVVPGFDELLAEINTPVLVLLGELDSQVDWQGTRALYQRTIGTKHPDQLTIKTFSNCNHSLMQAETGALYEDLGKFNYQMCDGFFETMKAWLSDNELIDSGK